MRDGVSYWNYVSPSINSNQVEYTVRLGIDQETIDGQFSRLASLFINLAGVGILIGILAAYLLAARFSKPIIGSEKRP